MSKPPLLPLPEPFSADAAVRHLYGAWTNRGRIHVESILLRNPAMVIALFELWLQEQPPGVERREAVGFLNGIGYWRLVWLAPGSEAVGELQFSPELWSKDQEK